MKELKSSYQDAYEIFQYYWRIYGGWKALFCSPYLYVAILFLVLTQHQWLTRGWWEQSFAILPNLLGFSLGGFAIFLGLGDEQFRSVLAEKDENEPYSAYTFVSATFVHFILIQCLGIVSALLAESLAYRPIWLNDATMYYFEYITPVFWAIGYLFLLYSLTSMLAVVMAIFRCTRWYEKHQEMNSENDEDN